ncbi:MAG: YfbU family protein [Polyangiaceae bacterium]
MTLTKTERWLLLNQLTILAILKPDNDNPALRRALEKGWEVELRQFCPVEDATPGVSFEVQAVLGMFECLQLRGRELGYVDGRLRFRGFQGSSELEHFDYARHLFQSPHHDFSRFDGRECTYCAHVQLPRYRAMLAAHQKSRTNTKEDMALILEAGDKASYV